MTTNFLNYSKIRETHKLDWAGLTFLIVAHAVVIFGSLYLILYSHIPKQTWMLGLVLYLMTGFSISIGYHRLFSHRSFKASWPLKFLLLFFGSASFQNSALKWSFNHRCHHRHTDHPIKDPYGIANGFLFSHLIWIAFASHETSSMVSEWRKNNKESYFPYVKDLESDPLIKFQHKYYFPIAVLTCFLMPAAIASLWGDFWGGLVIAGFARMALLFQMVGLINSACHYFGKQPHTKKNQSRDNVIVSWIAFGDGYHNYHHAFPFDYRCGVGFFKFDPSKWLIKLFEWLRMAKDLQKR